MSVPPVAIKVKVSGPLLTAPSRHLAGAITLGIKRIALEGEGMAVKMAQPASAGRFHTRGYAADHGYTHTGNYARSIHGKLVSSMQGRIDDGRSVYGPWLEGTGSRNQTTRFKGYHIMRDAAAQLQRKAKGIMGAVLDNLIRRLR